MPRKQKRQTPLPRIAGVLVVFSLLAAVVVVALWRPRPTPLRSAETLPPTVSSNQSGFLGKIATPGPASTNQVHGPFNTLDELMNWLKSETNSAEVVDTATRYLEGAFPREAILCFSRAIELKPDDEDATFNLAYAYAKAGATDQAILYYNKAIEIFPEYADAHHNLGNLLLQRKAYDAAIEHFNAAIKAQPEHSLAHNGLGRALAEQGRVREALPHFAESVRLDPKNVEPHFNLATSYMVLHRTNDAVAELHEVLKLRPGFPPALQVLARIESIK